MIYYIIGDSTKRYEALLAKLRELLNALQAALASSQGLHEQLDMTLRWLDEAERNVHKMEKGTVIVAQKEPLQENMKEQMVGLCRVIQGTIGSNSLKVVFVGLFGYIGSLWTHAMKRLKSFTTDHQNLSSECHLKSLN